MCSISSISTLSYGNGIEPLFDRDSSDNRYITIITVNWMGVKQNICCIISPYPAAVRFCHQTDRIDISKWKSTFTKPIQYKVNNQAYTAFRQTTQAADVDKNGKVNAKDALFILRCSINMAVLPVEK